MFLSYRNREKLVHHTIFNETKTKNESNSTELFFSSSYPVPIISGNQNYCSEKHPDPVTDFVKIKNNFNKTKNELKNKCLPREIARLKSYSRKSNKSKPVISQNVKNFMEHLATDPLPEYSEDLSYNFFLAGGNLESIKFNADEAIIVSPIYTQDYQLEAATINFNDWRLMDKNDTKIEIPALSYAYEITNSRLIRRELDTVLRLPYQFLFYSSTELKIPPSKKSFSSQFVWQKSRLLSGSFVNYSEFAFIDLDNKLTKIDLSDNSENYNNDLMVDSLIDRCPMIVREWDFHQVTVSTPMNLNLLDFRSNEFTKLYDVPRTSQCEKISAQLKSDLDKNLIYIGLTHHLVGIDVRFPKKCLMQWTHQLEKPPTMIKSVDFLENEVVCLSSNLTGDWKIFNNQKNEDENIISINRLSFKPKSILNSLEECQLRGKFIINSHVERHCRNGVTGICLLNENDTQLHLFTQNSIGDVFNSTLITNNSITNDPGIFEEKCNFQNSIMEKFDEWNELLEKHGTKKTKLYNVNKIRNVRHLKKLLKCPKIEEESDCVKIVETTNNAPWQVNMETLRAYKDVLASDLLSIWEVELETTEQARPAILIENNLQSDPTDKSALVSDWINFTTVVKEEEVMFEDSYIIDHPPPTQQNINQSRRSNVKLKSYVKGF